MRHLRTFLLLAAALVLIAGCGTSSSPDLTGSWLGQTTSGGGGTAVTFTITMQEGALNGNSAPVTISNFVFQTQNSCFDNTATASGTVTTGTPRTLSGNVASGPGNPGNSLTFNMQVAADNNSASGTYSLVGGNGGCIANDTGSLTFTRQ